MNNMLPKTKQNPCDALTEFLLRRLAPRRRPRHCEWPDVMKSFVSITYLIALNRRGCKLQLNCFTKANYHEAIFVFIHFFAFFRGGVGGHPTIQQS